VRVSRVESTVYNKEASIGSKHSLQCLISIRGGDPKRVKCGEGKNLSIVLDVRGKLPLLGMKVCTLKVLN
jgi:hypothetical protein